MTAAPIYAGAVPIRSVVCPPWCKVSQQEHLDELANWEGMSIHTSEHLAGETFSVRLSTVTYADGTPDPTEPPVVYVNDREMAIGEASILAATILHAVETLAEGRQ